MKKILPSSLQCTKKVQGRRNKARIRIRVEDHLVAVGIGLGILFWILEALIHTFIYNRK